VSDLFRYSAGQRGVNRVVIYERKRGGILQIEYWLGKKRVQVSTRTILGFPMLAKTAKDRKLARRVADKVAAEHRRTWREYADNYVRDEGGKTVGELLKALHRDRESEWSDRYRQEQAHYRLWWTSALGGAKVLTAVSPALVRRCVADGTAEKGWGATTQRYYLRYIKEALTWAVREGWLDKSPLEGLRFPKLNQKREAYSRDELTRLLPALVEVDLRAGTIAHIAYWTGRRMSSIRQLRWDDIDGNVIHFPPETDKVGNAGAALIPEPVRVLIEGCRSYGSEHLFPGADGPITKTPLYKFLREAERRAEVPRKKQRGYHSLKRAFATDSQALPGRKFQAGTTEEMLDGRYVHFDRAQAEELLRGLEERRKENP